MFSMVALRQGLPFRFIAPILPVTPVARLIHFTPVVLKKKDKGGSSPQTFFDDVEDGSQEGLVDEELFSSAKTSSTRIPKPDQAAASTARTETFESLLTSSLQHFDKQGKKGNPPRRSVVQQLCIVADTKEQLEKILDFTAVYRNASIPFLTEDFFGRCITLGCPELILQALQNRSKYGMEISSLESARTILNALAVQQKDDPEAAVTSCLTFAELYPLFGFPPASKDIVSSVILAGVIAQARMKKGMNAEPEDGVIEVPYDSFPEILEEVKAATALWTPSSVAFKREGRWLRKNMDYIMPVARREGHMQPWLRDLTNRIKSI